MYISIEMSKFLWFYVFLINKKTLPRTAYRESMAELIHFFFQMLGHSYLTYS